METEDIIVDDITNIDEDEDEPHENKFKFPPHILWSVFFEVDKQSKTMKCKLCTKSFKFTKSASSTNGNKHLNIKDLEHQNLVLSKVISGFNSGEWNDERQGLLLLLQ